jgi:ParB family chromosome partitioning protein
LNARARLKGKTGAKGGETVSAETVQNIQLDVITPHPANRRVGGFDQGKLEDLARSIAAVGVQQPAVVLPLSKTDPRLQSGAKYELVAGERRWRASKIALCETLPCMVRELDDATTLRIQIIENLQREDVHPLDEAEGYARLLEEGQYDVEHVASELGKSVGYVYQRLKLRDLESGARELLIEGRITSGHAMLIARLGTAQQREVLEGYLLGALKYDEGPTIRQLETWIQANILMELSGASWKLDDATLLPDAGACAACPKRTLSHPELFAEVGKKDHCTDRACFLAKGAALVERRRAELKDTEHLEVSDSYSRTGLKKDKGVLESFEWRECKKKDPGAMKVLVVTGNQPGKLTWGKVLHAQRGEASAEEKAAEKGKKDAQKAKKEAGRAVFEAVIDKLKLEIKKRKRLPEEILRLVVTGLWARSLDDQRTAIAKWEGWEKTEERGWTDAGTERIAGMDEPELFRFLAVCTLASGLVGTNSWAREPIGKSVVKAAALCGVSAAEMLSGAYEKYSVPSVEREELEDESEEGASS